MAGTLEKQATRRARTQLEGLAQQAHEQGWSVEELEREKQRLALGLDVTLCATLGCLEIVTAAVGYRDLRCARCCAA